MDFLLKGEYQGILSNGISFATMLITCFTFIAVLVQSRKITKQNSINTILILG